MVWVLKRSYSDDSVSDDDPPVLTLFSEWVMNHLGYRCWESVFFVYFERMSFSGIISMILKEKGNSRVHPKEYRPIPSVHWRSLKQRIQ
jgi:hypothetical protein